MTGDQYPRRDVAPVANFDLYTPTNIPAHIARAALATLHRHGASDLAPMLGLQAAEPASKDTP